MNEQEHKERHVELHQALDELVADFITQTNKRPSNTTVLELMLWSSDQTQLPTNPANGQSSAVMDDSSVERHGRTLDDDRVYSDSTTGATPKRR